MKYKEYTDETCEIICEDNGRKIVADVLSFTKEKMLTVSVEKSLKLSLAWNGKVYEGQQGRMSFISNGPDSRTVRIQR